MNKSTATIGRVESPLSKLISDSPVGPPLEGTVDQLLDQLKLKENRLRTQFELTKTPTLQKLISLNDLLTQRGGGSILLQNCDTTGLQGSVKELAAALRFIGSYKGKINVVNQTKEMSDEAYLDALITINKACADEFSFQPRGQSTRILAGTSQKLCAALKKARGHSGDITVTDQPTVDQLILIQHARTKPGKITLQKQEALSGTGEELMLALKGFPDYKGQITITD